MKIIKKCLIFATASSMMPTLFSFSSCSSSSNITVNESSVQINIQGEAEFHFQMHSTLQGGLFNDVTLQQKSTDEDKKLKIILYPSFIDKTNFLMKIGFYSQKRPNNPVDIHFNIVFNWYTASDDYKTQVITGLNAKYQPEIISPSEKTQVFQTEYVDDKYVTSGSFNDFIIYDQSIPLLDLQPHATCEQEQIHGNVYASITGNANKFNLSISILTDSEISVGVYPLSIWIQINGETIYWSQNEFSFRIER